MSNVVNEAFKEQLLEDVLELKGNDIWNVIFAIEREFGVANLPNSPKSNECFINALVELRFEEALI